MILYTESADAKTCCRCEETKPLAFFSKRTAARDGLVNHCRMCEAARKMGQVMSNEILGGAENAISDGVGTPEDYAIVERARKAEARRAARASKVAAPIYGKLTVERDLGGAWWVMNDGGFLEPASSRDAARARMRALKSA